MLRLDDGEILKRFDTAFSVVNDAISTLRKELGAPVGPNLLVYHLHSLAQRTKDVRFIVRRMLSNVKRLEGQRSRVLDQRREESIEPGGRFSARYCRLSNRMDEIVQALRLDFEAVFHIGSVAYDHFAVSCKHLGAHPPTLRAKDKFEFHELVEHLDSKSPSPIARALRNELAPEVRWLHYWMRSYRNGFVVHPDRPLQQSLVHGPGSKFALFTPHARACWLE